MRARALLSAAVALVALSASTTDADAKRGFTTGFADSIYQFGSSSQRALYLDRAEKANAGIIRVFVSWSDVATSKPDAPADPGDPAYDFGSVDIAVTEARARGLNVLLTTLSAPPWAEGRSRRKSAPAGSWMPKPGAVADFHEALARRYSGSFEGLPRVRHYQVWNEPNIDTYLSPAWKGRRLVAAGHYRKMLNVSSKAVNSVSRGNVVISAGLAPYGDGPGGNRSRPLRFWRELFCLNGKLRRACKAKTDFEIFGEHAINTSAGPTKSALHPDDASSGDLPQMREVLRAAEKAGTVNGRHPIWVTEFWWESNPPDPAQGVPLKTQARYIAETMHLARKAGASAAIYLQIRDSEFSRATRFERNSTGIYFFNDKAKPSARAFAFPFAADRSSLARVRIWGKAPGSGRVVIEQKRRGAWRKVETLDVGEGGVFTGIVGVNVRARLRARTPGERSLEYQLR